LQKSFTLAPAAWLVIERARARIGQVYNISTEEAEASDEVMA